jgi:hypothetical protein
MKILSVIIVILLFGCQKENEDPVNFDGYWSGKMNYLSEGKAESFNIHKSIQGDTSLWSDSNIPLVRITFTGNTYVVIYSDLQKGTCNGISGQWESEYRGTGYKLNDSLFEQGAYKIEYYSANKLIIRQTGTWTAAFARTYTWQPI